MKNFSIRFAAACAGLLLQACASAPVQPATAAHALAAYRTDPFAPVNLIALTADDDADSAAGLPPLLAQLKLSGAFAELQTGARPWPITLELRYAAGPWTRLDGRAHAALSALTLGAVPARKQHQHALTVNVMHQDERVRSLVYGETAFAEISALHADDTAAADANARERLIARMLEDLERQHLVPHVSDLKREQKKIRRKKGVVL